ncbi:uncharacterized protein LOC123988151 [Osmia bicornis bicornis]|uniref:uncharacterized protein LOC123988151 n=1 Tax=Osmia bicornis bicornis TaxID=1437191 RepID=UPI001EAEDA46|nr:uncharacterized protein LOC123988151 [Osmia bicornis bicornis]
MYQVPSTSNVGRPVKSLEDCSEVTRRQKLREHNQNMSTDLINQGLCQRYKSERQYEKASIVEAVDEVGPDLLNEMKNTIRTANHAPRKFTAEEALSLFLDLGLSKDKYTVLRNELKKRNHNALPSYNEIIQARSKCLPEIDEVTSVSAKVSLQKLLDSTVNGIIQLKTESEIEALNDTNLLLTSKWGCDGSSGQSEYKQKLGDNVNSIVTDSNMFMVSMVPSVPSGELLEAFRVQVRTL